MATALPQQESLLTIFHSLEPTRESSIAAILYSAMLVVYHKHTRPPRLSPHQTKQNITKLWNVFLHQSYWNTPKLLTGLVRKILLSTKTIR
jgi:hypothetical protein